MKYLLIYLNILGFVVADGAMADTHKQDIENIRELIDTRTAGFNRRDAHAQALLFTENADFYGSDGFNHVQGRQHIEELLSIVLGGGFANAKLEQSISQVVFPSRDVALVTIAVTVTRPSSDGIGTYRNRGLRVLKRSDGAWLIRTFINQRVVETEAATKLNQTLSTQNKRGSKTAR